MGNRIVTTGVAGALVLSTALPGAVGASDTPPPATVTIAGSLQSELGCAGDWDPACATTHLAYDANGDTWVGTFAVPAGDFAYKAALNDAWTENYGDGGARDGTDIIALWRRFGQVMNLPLFAVSAEGQLEAFVMAPGGASYPRRGGSPLSGRRTRFARKRRVPSLLAHPSAPRDANGAERQR